MQMEAISSKMVGRAAQTVPSPHLVQAAHEFEGQMMKELLRPMTSGREEGGEDGPGWGGALGEFAGEALGQALSARGGFGIADRIVHDLSRPGNRIGPGTITGSTPTNTILRSSV